MRQNPIVCLICLIMLVLTVLPVSADQEPGPNSDLFSLMQREDHPWRGQQGEMAVWVYFRDKEPWESNFQEALDAAKKRLTRKAVARRVKGRKPKAYGQMVDGKDFPLGPEYLQQILDLGAVKRAESRWLNAASFDVAPELVAQIADLPFVVRVVPVQKFKRTPVSTLPESLLPVEDLQQTPDGLKSETLLIDYGPSIGAMEQINVPPVHAEGVTGKGVLVGMMDTGFRVTHEALQHINVVDQWDFVNDDAIVDTEEGDPLTSHYHGTMTLSTIAGYSPGNQVGPAYEIDVILAKTEDVSQEIPIEEDFWVEGLEWLESQGVDIVSSSLGYHDWYDFEDLDGNTAVTTIAADIAVGLGVAMVNSAGNERLRFGHLIAPSDGDSVISAGAVTILDAVASFSSPGPTADGRIKPDISALGVGVRVTSPIANDEYQFVSGTSFSCPLSAGVVSLLLSHMPGLTPMQIREALRMTASQAQNPDNDYGWGIIDAYAALHYYGPTFTHTPLVDTENVSTPYAVACLLTDRIELVPATIQVMYRVDEGIWLSAALINTTGDQYSADIPAQSPGSVIDYYLIARDELNIENTLPAQAPLEYYSFRVGPDVTPPLLVHNAFFDLPLQIWPPQVYAQVTDNLGVASVTVSFMINGTPQADFGLDPLSDDFYGGYFPTPVESMSIGDLIRYEVTATDLAAAPNIASTGPLTFEIIDSLGNVLLIDDNTPLVPAATLKFDAAKQVVTKAALTTKDSAPEIERWLRSLGYIVESVAWADFSEGDLIDRDIVVLSCGSNESPLNTALRDTLASWTDAGGRLLVEGGETAYDALVWPVYTPFAQTCLRVTAWGGDSVSDLTMPGGPYDHPLTSHPYLLPQTIPLQVLGFADLDLALPAPDTQLLYASTAELRHAGLLVHDDNTAPAGGQIVNMCFNLSAVTDTTIARSLLANALSWLSADEGQPTGTLEGDVTLGGGDALLTVEGAQIDLGHGLQAVTDQDGYFQLGALYPGDYTLTWSRADLSREMMDITIVEGQTLSLNLNLWPVSDVKMTNDATAPVPDNDGVGIFSTVQISQPGRVSSLDVDIDLQHPWIGDLVVCLLSPSGTKVRLHNRGGSSHDDITGNYPQTLTVSGPGMLDDFYDEEIHGAWTLQVADMQASDTGSLLTWTLNIKAAALQTSGVSATPPRHARMWQNSPNPFNPRTRIRFQTVSVAAPQLQIFDLRGRMVRQLLSGRVLQPAVHDVIWDGTDDRGRPVPSGLYLYRLVVDGDVVQRKMLLAK
jgi:subtilisin-like proprotein convertase family protein